MRRAFLGLAVAALTALGVAAPSSAVLGQAKQVTQGHISAAEVLALPEAPATGQTGLLAGISAVSPSNIWAVGSYTSSGAERTLVMHWNGTAWTKVASPNPGPTFNSLSAVSAVSPSDAWAVGSYGTSTGAYRTLVMHWNGTAWTKVASPDPGPTFNSLSAVSAVSPSDAWAAGSYTTSTGADRTLMLHWNGTAWTKVASPNPGSGGNLSAVSALSPSDAWAAGYYGASTGAELTLVMHWNGTAWTKVASPNPASRGNFLSAVSALSPSDAWAVGGYFTTDDSPDRTLVMHWNGTAWTKVASPNPGSASSTLSAVSALSPSDAWAAGSYTTSTGAELTLVMHWNGTAWTKVASPSPASGEIHLNAVSALSPSDAWAVGVYYTSTGPGKTLVLHWNGTAWTRS